MGAQRFASPQACRRRRAGAAPPNTNLVYFAFGNYTTLGYGDVVPVPKWHLLGPMTALNGVMLIGWSTALIFEILHRSRSQPESP